MTQQSTLDDVCRDFVRAITEHHALSPECDEAFLQALLAPLHQKKCNIRDFESIEESAIRVARRIDKLSPKLVFTKTHLQAAVNDMLDTDIDTNYGIEKLSEEDQRHQDQLTQNREQHKTNLKQQRALHNETVALQKEQFVQGLRIQKAMQSNQLSGGGNVGFNVGTSGINFGGGASGSVNNISISDACITSNLSDEQVAMYRRQTELTQRREQERNQVKDLFKPLQEHIAFLTTIKEMFGQRQTSEIKGFIARIEKVVTAYTHCYSEFSELEVPSVAELQTMTQLIVSLSSQALALKTDIKTYLDQQSSGCIIS